MTEAPEIVLVLPETRVRGFRAEAWSVTEDKWMALIQVVFRSHECWYCRRYFVIWEVGSAALLRFPGQSAGTISFSQEEECRYTENMINDMRSRGREGTDPELVLGDRLSIILDSDESEMSNQNVSLNFDTETTVAKVMGMLPDWAGHSLTVILYYEIQVAKTNLTLPHQSKE